jgi:ABC-type transport system involved in multi-copper enzyme maturation permease subunit
MTLFTFAGGEGRFPVQTASGAVRNVRLVNRFCHVVTAELTKIRTVRSATWTLLLTPLICTCLGYAVSHSLRLSFPRLPPQQRRDFDPLFAAFYSLSIGQLALAAFGVTVTGSEYSTGMIVTSLTAVPRRGLFYAAKIAAGSLVAAATALVTVAATFLAAQPALGPHRASPVAPATVQAVLGACLYLVLVCALAMGITAILRVPALALAIMMPLLFLDSQGLGNVPGLQKVIDYLPDQAGSVIVHLSGSGEGHFSRPFGPWTGMAIMAAWTAAALIGGYLVLARTDVTGASRREVRRQVSSPEPGGSSSRIP